MTLGRIDAETPWNPTSRGRFHGVARRLLHDPDMKTSDLASHVDTVYALPRESSALHLADNCRDAALVFVNESPFWGKAELAMWLLGPYSQAAHRVGARPEQAPPALREIDLAEIEHLLACARAEVLDALERLRDPELAARTVFAMIASGFVAGCQDARGGTGWVPTTNARRLADRVLSLFAVDYLARPGDYENILATCAACEHVAFDELAARRGICNRHGVTSEVPDASVEGDDEADVATSRTMAA